MQSKTDTIRQMRLQDQVLTEQDFDQLPPALRRKVSTICGCPSCCHRDGFALGQPRLARCLPFTIHAAVDRVDHMFQHQQEGPDWQRCQAVESCRSK